MRGKHARTGPAQAIASAWRYYTRRGGMTMGKHGDDSKATDKGSQGGGKHEGDSKDGKGK